MRALLVAVLVLALGAPAAANCLAQSQNAIAEVQLENAYSISAYTWQGDPWYDQVMPLCAKTALREFGCNAAFNLGLRAIEDRVAPRSPIAVDVTCIANYLGAVAFGLYIRRAVWTQIYEPAIHLPLLHVRF